ncbi:ABC transporter ATP-binding protein [Paenibacillus alvei]|uniref:ABC transporter ATP-binding protein n=1 Tax=Paenibacillus alvei TaxID=44250 RepID=A0ABT4GYH8_PAEAL|nr:ABC transporter ATP-binding protein [Paenibacillus alvei]MCY9539570.1 ABC transporter ATP-binding protein [Paenibacillus alvei]MCY9704018.1 ABC transporter ATP-binding protein [Paenibacillus alvei]MCY9734015.1 ABC transporter ATP-binding protein [Paenibacillus alvei]MCY9753825.1 ABC transporter ATP-binding protein [Paenibacillus alvei]MCY9761472.1 ABC transporter ATP-binding protein [Paenibacillus alvei]
MNAQPVVATRGLSKFYNHVCRVNNINLEVLEGEIYGFLGPNGAGKSTTLKMLLGLAKPTDGRITLFGQELGKHRRTVLNQIGSLIESPSYYGHLTGLENMRVMQKLRGVPSKNVEEALRIVRLENQKNKQVEHYSLGMKQRLGIAMALISYPKLLILDEPTNGLDPAGIGEIRELIKSLPRQYGITVLLSSHLLSEIEQIATSVGIISDGNLLYQGKMETLQERNRSSLAIRTSNNTAAAAWMQNQGYMASLRDECLQIKHMSDQQVARLNKELVLSGIDVLRIEERKRTLEDIFLELTGRERSL